MGAEWSSGRLPDLKWGLNWIRWLRSTPTASCAFGSRLTLKYEYIIYGNVALKVTLPKSQNKESYHSILTNTSIWQLS